MGGAAAWLRRARDELDPATTLVVGLDQIGAGDPHVLTGEGPPLLARYRDEDVERTGLPTYHTAGWTDPIVARLRRPARDLDRRRRGRRLPQLPPADRHARPGRLGRGRPLPRRRARDRADFDR